MREKYRIVFFGTPAFAVPSLKALFENGFNLAGCVTKPDTPQGRNLRLTPSPVKKLSLEYKLPVWQPEKMDDPVFFENLKKSRPDVIVVVAFGKILPREILNLPPFGGLNIHASLLPKYRGPSPIHYALLNNEPVTGVSLMKMAETMDTGPILVQEKIKISEQDNLASLHQRLAALGAELLVKNLPLYLAGKIRPKSQDNAQATYTKKIIKNDGHLDFNLKAEEIARRIRAFNPWPGTFAYWAGKPLKITKVALTREETRDQPGKVQIFNKMILVAAGDKILEIKKIQLAGHKELRTPDFISGYPQINKAVLN